MDFRPGELADWLDVSTATIRNWSADFAEFLSPSASGGDGRHRIYTEHDARVLAHIGNLRRSGNGTDEIAASLAVMQAEGWQGLPPMPPAPPGVEPQSMMSVQEAERAVHLQRQALMREIALLQDRIESLDAQLSKVRQDWAEERSVLQADLLEKTAELGKLRGKLEGVDGERESWHSERRLLLRGLVAVAVVAAVLLAVVVLLSLTGGLPGG